MAEGVALAVMQAGGGEQVLGGLGGDVGVALGLDAVVHIPRDKAPADFGDAGKVVGGAGAGLSKGRGEGTAEKGEEGDGQDVGGMHCGSFVFVGV